MGGAELAILAAILKGYEVYAKNKKSKQVNRDRLNAQRAANQQSRLEAEEALAASKKSRDMFDEKVVGDKRIAEEKRLGTLLKAIPKKEYAVADPTRRGESSIITNAKAAAKKEALGDILGYAGDKASLTAATGVGQSPSQAFEGMESRYRINEAARRQQEIQRLLALKMAGVDPRSMDAQIAGIGGDIALMAAFGA